VGWEVIEAYDGPLEPIPPPLLRLHRLQIEQEQARGRALEGSAYPAPIKDGLHPTLRRQLDDRVLKPAGNVLLYLPKLLRIGSARREPPVMLSRLDSGSRGSGCDAGRLAVGL
jgi:hypothetical protein